MQRSVTLICRSLWLWIGSTGGVCSFKGDEINRRNFLANTVLAAGASAFAVSARNDQQAVLVTVRTDQPLGVIAPDFMGLGYEISSVAKPGLMNAANSVYVQLVRTLGARGVIRIGGNTSDFAHYSATAAAVSSAYGTVVNDAVLRDLGGFLKATGWKLIWGLDLGRGSESEAIAEAKAVLPVAGERLLAIEIGNEPDQFPGHEHRKPEYYGMLAFSLGSKGRLVNVEMDAARPAKAAIVFVGQALSPNAT